MMDLSAVILSLSSGTYTVTRSTNGGTGLDGYAADGVSSTFTIAANVQPARGRDLQRNEEGQRASAAKQIITPTELKTRSAGYAPDVVSIEGALWQVEKVEPWGDGNFWRAIATKQGD